MKLSNNSTRIIVSVLAIPLIIAAAYFGKIYFLLFTIGVSLISFFEFSTMAGKKGIKTNIWIGAAAILILILNQADFNFYIYPMILFLIILLLITELFRNNGSPIMNLGGTLLGIFYPGLFGSALIALREFYPEVGNLYIRGGYLIITIFASIWICDSAAYFGGTALGKHKLFLRVSPNKSWEGAAFGFVFSILAVIAAKFLVLDFLSWKAILGIGLTVGIVGQVGDLAESLLKRDSGVKDSSALIPGHGGIFDRFDSILMTAPAVYLLLRYVL